jgi:NADH-quinone oxidoreductase subunit H
MAGLGSGNKYSLMGGLRSAAQLVSYEIPRALSVVGVVMMAGTLSIVHIVNEQDRVWFILPQLIGFFVYYIASIAETNRVPFDIPEAESELVSGFNTEYSGIRFAIFFMAEYANVFAAGAIGTVLFFGGWSGPLLPPFVWMLIKVFAIFVMPFIFLRWTLPRFRADQLMALCWKVLLPLSLVNIALTGVMTILAKGWIGG